MRLYTKFHTSTTFPSGRIEFHGGWGGVVCKVIFVSNPTSFEVKLDWVDVVVGVVTIQINYLVFITEFEKVYILNYIFLHCSGSHKKLPLHPMTPVYIAESSKKKVQKILKCLETKFFSKKHKKTEKMVKIKFHLCRCQFTAWAATIYYSKARA